MCDTWRKGMASDVGSKPAISPKLHAAVRDTTIAPIKEPPSMPKENSIRPTLGPGYGKRMYTKYRQIPWIDSLPASLHWQTCLRDTLEPAVQNAYIFWFTKLPELSSVAQSYAPGGPYGAISDTDGYSTRLEVPGGWVSPPPQDFFFHFRTITGE